MPLGLLETVGFARESNAGVMQWPSASPAVVMSLAPLLGESVTSRLTSRLLSPVDAQGYQYNAEVDRQTIAGQVTLRARYGGLEDLWCAALGLEARHIGSTAMPATVASGAYRHLFEIDDSLEAEHWAPGDGWFVGASGMLVGSYKLRRGTLVITKGVSAWEIKSAMVTGWEFALTPGGVTLALDIVGHSLSRAGSNTLTTMAQAQKNATPNALFHQAVMRMDSYSASTALSGADEIKVVDLVLRCNNNLTTFHGPRTGNQIEEPARQGPAEITGSLTIARHSVDTFLSRYESGSLQMLDLKFTGPSIAGTATPHQLNLYLPSVILSQVDVPQSSAAFPVTISFAALRPSTAAAGFPATSRLGPLQVEVVSGRSTNPLA